MVRPTVVFVLGPPGSGKGTQCRKLAKNLNFVHISAGELLRRESNTPSSHHGKLIISCFNQGKIVPSEITCKLLEREIEKFGEKVFLIDGFPRNDENRLGWEKTFQDKVQILFVLLIDCPGDVCIQRCLGRGAASASGRRDDNKEIVEKRIKSHIQETQPTIDHFRGVNLLKVIDGSRTEDQVFEDIIRLFSEFSFPNK